jgi:YD repeat-containing protein
MHRTEKSRLHRAIAWGASLLLLAAMVPPILAQNSALQYFYDDLGQLIRAVDQNGNVATYNYDSRGNLLSITRSTLPPSNGLSILNFTPQSGPVGQSVTIQGQGFSTTLSSNTVQFNGVAAAVTAATANTLTVTVPSTATTGPISVTVSTQTTTTGANFNVTNQLTSFAVSPQNVSVHFGAQQQQQFTATGYYTGGSSQNLTAAASWGSSNPTVATISNSPGSQGLATIVGSGTTTLTASYGASLGSATLVVASPVSVSVTPSSATIFALSNQQFSATETFSDGSSQNVTSQVTWSSTNTNVLTVNSTTSPGLATGVKAGTATVCASVSGGPSTCSSVTVTAALVSLSISPANESIPKAVSQQLTATGLFNDGSTQNLTSSVTWSSSNPTVATIVGNGLATDVGEGTTTISATLGAISGSTSLTLTAPAAASVSVNPSPAAISAGGMLQLTANLVFTDGSTQNVTQTATWSTSAADVAVVSNAVGSQGLVTRVGPGTAIITAASGSFSGIALVANSSATSYPRFVYVSNGGGNIFIYSVNSQTGQLRANGSVQVSNQSGNLALDPSQSYLYFSVPSAAGNLFAFSVNPANGALTQISGSPYTAGTSTGPVVTDPSDRFVYVGDPSSDSIFGFSIGAGGALTALPGSPYPAGGAPSALVAHPSGRFLFELNQNQGGGGADPPGSVSVFAINSNNGALSAISGSPFEVGDTPVALAEDPAGNYLFVSNMGQSNSSRMRRPKSRDDFEVFLARPSVHPEPRDLLGISDHAGSDSPTGVARTRLFASLDMNSFSPFPVTATDGGAFAPARSPFAGLFFQAGGSSPSISAFTVDPNAGTLTEVSGSPFGVSSGLSSISVDTTGQYLYGETYNSLFGFSINGGALTPLSNSPFSLSVGPIVFDPSGLFAYAPSGNGVQEMGTNSSTGTLTALPGGTPVGGVSIAISGGSAPIIYVPQFAYVVSSGAANGANNIAGYSINAATGALTRLEGSPFAEGFFPVFATADMFGQSLYVANNCSDLLCAASNGSVSGYAISPGSGALTAAAGSPFPAGVAPVSVALQPPGINAQSSNEYAYIASQNSQFFEYAVNPATGVLTTFAGSPAYTSANGVIATAVDPTGSYLYVITSCSGCANDVLYGYDLFLYDGQLIYQPPVITAALGTAPQAIGVDPGGRFVLVTDGASNTVSVLSTQASYSQVTGSPFATDGNPSAVALDPTGQFVYIANQATNDVSAYTMNPSTGSLTPISGSPYAVGMGPVSLSVDFSGEFLYVTNNGDGTVSAFSITAGSGALTPVPGSPFTAGAAPVSVVTTGTIQ